jgi:filamentous hemagglutinin family protein
MTHPPLFRLGLLFGAIALSPAFDPVLGRGPVLAQVVEPIAADTTLPTPTRVTPAAGFASQTTITGGTQAGGTLFHSFDRFSIPAGQTALFQPGAAVQQIITRVTGTGRSQILGTLAVDGPASFFLLNPNGIDFGPNARLALNGSFLATTARAFQFADGREFSATNPQAPPLLAINVPLGLQFGAAPGAITQRGTLVVPTGQSLDLVGGDVQLLGGRLVAPGGRVQVGSVRGASSVPLASLLAPPQWLETLPLGDISLTDAAEITTSGAPAGPIQIWGRSLALSGDSRIISVNVGNQPGSPLVIHTQDAVTLSGTGNYIPTLEGLLDGTVSPLFLTNSIYTLATESGQAGDLSLTTRVLRMDNGSYLGSGSSYLGNGSGDTGAIGRVLIQATDSLDLSQSLIISGGIIGSPATANDVTITTGQLRLSADAVISLFPSGAMRPENARLTITADDMHLVGGQGFWNASVDPRIPRDRLSTGVFTSSFGVGSNLQIHTGTLRLERGAWIRSASYFAAGNITVVADALSIGSGSQIISNSFQANSGNISITSRREVDIAGAGSGLFSYTGLLSNNGVVTVVTGSTGDGGDITVTSDRVTVRDQAKLNASTSDGSGGSINIRTREFVAQSGGQLRTISFGVGPAGSITITATDRATIQGTGVANPGVLFLRDAVANGNIIAIPPSLDPADPFGGAALIVDSPKAVYPFQISTQEIFLLTAGETGILASAYNRGTGGSVTLNSPLISIQDQAIVSVSAWGTGGSGQLRLWGDRITLQDAFLLASTISGNGGIVDIQASRLSLDRTALLAANAVGTGSNIQLKITDLLLLRRGSQVNARAFGTGMGGNIQIAAGWILAIPSENSDITARAIQQRGGTIQIAARGLYGLRYQPRLTPFSDITASSDFGLAGSVQIAAPQPDAQQTVPSLPTQTINATQQVAVVCSPQMRRNSFVATGRGGLLPSPAELLMLPQGWSDATEPHSVSAATDVPHRSGEAESGEIAYPIEAAGWLQHPDGTIDLIAATTAATTATAATATAFNPSPSDCPQATAR